MFIVTNLPLLFNLDPDRKGKKKKENRDNDKCHKMRQF